MTASEYAASRPDLANNWENAFLDEFADDGTAIWIRSFGSFAEYLQADYGRPFDQEKPPPAPEPISFPQLLVPGSPVVIAPDMAPVGGAPFVAELDPPLLDEPPEPNEPPTDGTVSAPGAVSSPIMNLSPATPAPVSSPSNASNMTAAQYAAARPDLRANWDRAQQSGFDDDPTAEWIRSWGSFEEYLRQDYGREFDAPASGSNPPANTNSAGTSSGSPTTTTTTGGSNTTLVSPNDASILGGIDQFLRTASGILGALTGSNNQPAPTTTTTTTTAAQNQTKTLLLVGGVALAAFFVARSMS